jgi:membrane protease YdiL (CAAX protease family)
LIVLGLSIIEGVLFYNQKLNIETLLFQLTLPGIDEEIAYRGIILGLFSSFMVNKISLWKITIHHPSIWIVGTLFGLIHALQFNQEWELTFDLLYFIKTFLLGTIWSYMTIKTKSILFPVLSHNLSNTLTNLIGMMK